MITLARRRRVPMNFGLGLVLGAVVLALSLTALIWTPYDPLAMDFVARQMDPSAAHPFGTDEFGRDLLSRIMVGGWTSLSVAFLTVAFAVILGTTLGILSGFLRGWFDRILMLLNDALLAFPGILLALALVAVIGQSKNGVILALGIAYVPKATRIVRSTVLSLREQEFIEASRALGNGSIFTMLRHVLPNALTPISVLATAMFGWVILVESALSFLGLGVPPPAPTWGNQLAAARPYLGSHPYMAIFPGLFITLTLLSVNLLGDALRDWLDPRMP